MKVEKVTEVQNPSLEDIKQTYTKPCIIRLKYKTRFNPSKEVKLFNQ